MIAKPINRALRLKRVKKQLAVLWSLAVRRRDGGRCVMCGKAEGLNAHHWRYRKSHSLALAFNPANGATLCAYPCHLGRIHHDGDGAFVARFFEVMRQKLGDAVIAEMDEIAKPPHQTITLEWLEELRDKFKERYENTNHERPRNHDGKSRL